MGKFGSLALSGMILVLSASDGRAQWIRAHVSGGSDISAGYLESYRHTVLYFAGDSSGILASSDEGATWTPDNSGLRLGPGSSGHYQHFCRSLSALGGEIFASMDGDSAGLFVSGNAGATWKPLPWSLALASRITSVATDGSLYYALSDNGNVYSFRIGDSAWTSVANILGDAPMPGFQSSAPHPVFSALLIRNGIFLANSWTTVTLDGGVYVSRDSGKTWAYGSLKDTAVYSIAGNGGSAFAATGRGIYRSSDDGLTWELLKNDIFPDTGLSGSTHVTSMYVGEKNIFVASFRTAADGRSRRDQNVYYSEDNGSSWKAIGTGLEYPPDLYVNAITLGDSDVFAVAGKELWKRPLREITAGIHSFGIGNRKSGLLIGNGAVLRAGDPLDFMVAKSGRAVIGLYDGNGKRRQTLANAEMAAGPHRIRFSPGRMRAGRYFLGLQTAGTGEARRVFVEN